MDQSVIVPRIHLNGSSAKTLIRNLENQYVAVRDLMKLLREGFPHGRDYYVEPGLYEKARAQQERRLRMLDSLKQELLAELGGIQGQIAARSLPF